MQFIATDLAKKGLSVRKLSENEYEILYKGTSIFAGKDSEVAGFLKKYFWKSLGKSTKELDHLNVLRFVEKYAEHLKTKPNEAFFWSGRTDGIGGQDIALEIALSKKGITLEGLIDKNKIPMPTWNPNDDNIQAIWSSISKKYADQVSGEIRAVVGKSVRKDNIWESFELPALKKNYNVKKITIIDPKTKKETIILKR